MKKYIILFVALALTMQLTAQESTLMHFMRWSPQSMRSNPANLSDTTRFYMGIPIFSNIAIDVNSGFGYSDLITRGKDNKLRVNRDGILNEANDRNRFTTDFSMELFSFGVRFREENMITFSLSAKTFGSVLIPKDAAVLLLEGNKPGGTIGLEADVNATAYVEAALGYVRKIDDNWKVGGRVKYLAGAGNVFGDMNASIHTDENTYALTLKSDALMHASITDFEEDGALANSGAAFDLGVYYKTPIEGLEASFSMIDWGWMTWNSGLKEFRSFVNNGEYTFAGLESLDGSFEAALDTLTEAFKFEETDTETAYTSSLPGKIFLGVSYNLTKADKFGFLFSTRALHNFQRTTFGLMYSRQVGNWFTVAAGNNFMMNKLFNPSLALLLRLKGFQFHIAAENISSFNPKDLRTVSLQFGMNIAVWAK